MLSLFQIKISTHKFSTPHSTLCCHNFWKRLWSNHYVPFRPVTSNNNWHWISNICHKLLAAGPLASQFHNSATQSEIKGGELTRFDTVEVIEGCVVLGWVITNNCRANFASYSRTFSFNYAFSSLSPFKLAWQSTNCSRLPLCSAWFVLGLRPLSD